MCGLLICMLFFLSSPRLRWTCTKMCAIICSLPWLHTAGPCIWWGILLVGCVTSPAPARKHSSIHPHSFIYLVSVSLEPLLCRSNITCVNTCQVVIHWDSRGLVRLTLWQMLSTMFHIPRFPVLRCKLFSYTVCFCLLILLSAARLFLALGCLSQWPWRRTTVADAMFLPSAGIS